MHRRLMGGGRRCFARQGLGWLAAVGLASSPAAGQAVADPTPPADAPPPLVLAGSARVMTGVEIRKKAASSSPDVDFFLQQARLSAQLEYLRRLELKVSVELADALDGPPQEGDVMFLRDAKLSYRLSPGFEFIAGRFKRPWSRLELTGDGDLPFRRRGEGNALITGDLGYGDRGIGVGSSGRVILDVESGGSLRGSVSVTAPSTKRNQVDLHARLEWSLREGIGVALSVAQKALETAGAGPSRWIGGRGYQFDARLAGAGWDAVVDASVAEDLRYENDAAEGFSTRPDAASVAGYVAYLTHLSSHTELQPVVFAEWVDRDIDVTETELVRITLGCNVLWQQRALRIMPQVELIRPRGSQAEADWPQREAYSLMFSSEL